MLNKNTEHLKKIRSNNKVASDVTPESKEIILALTAHENKEELEVLKKIGLDNHLRKQQAKADDIKRVTVVEDKFRRNVFTGQDLREYCHKYDLRLGLANRYKGPVKLDVAKEIIRLSNEHTITRERASGEQFKTTEINLNESSFFILTDDFDNGTTVTLLYNPNSSGSSYYAEEVRDSLTLVEVASFGKPFSELRMLRQLTYTSNGFFFFFLIAMLALGVIGFFISNSIVTPYLIVMAAFGAGITRVFSDDEGFESSWNFKKDRR